MCVCLLSVCDASVWYDSGARVCGAYVCAYVCGFCVAIVKLGCVWNVCCM